MLHPSTRKLIDKLIEMTAASKISWNEGDEGSCYYDTEGYRVTAGQSPCRVVVQDAGGRVLETVTDLLLSGTTDDAGISYALKVERMVSDVRRQLTGAEAIIDNIVSALDLDGDGIPDIEQTDDEAEKAAPTESLETTFPDQTEMASRVAMLAEKVNGMPPPVDDADEEDEGVELAGLEAPDEVEPPEVVADV